jgi:predicted RND superfamily exporter protein
VSYSRWAAAIGRHYRAVLVGSVLISIAAALSLTRLHLDIDVLTMLPRGTPAFDDFKSFVGEFGQLNELFLLVDGGSAADRQRFADALAPRLTAAATVAEVHARIDPEQVLDGVLGAYVFNYIPADAYDAIAERLTPAAIDAQVEADRAILAAPFDLTAARQVAADPLGFRRLAAAPLAESYAGTAPRLENGYFTAIDGTALLMFVRPTGTAFDTAFGARLLADVDQAIAATRAATGIAGVRVRPTGSYVIALEDAATFKRDIARYTVLALVGVLAVFYLGYGNLRVLPFVTYPLIVTTLVAFALSLVLYDQLNALSISFAAILYGLSIDAAIHFYSRLLEERARRHDTAAAVAATLASLGRANIAATLTSAGAFVVIGLSVLTTVRQLGVLTAIGMALTMLEFFTLYPALAFLLGDSVQRRLRSAETPRLAAWATAVEARAAVIRPLAIAAAALLCLGASRVRLETNLDALRPRRSPAMAVQDEIAARFLRAPRSGAVLVRRADLETALVDAERVAAVLRAARRDGLVQSVESIDAVLPSAHAQRERLQRYDALPRAAAAAALRESLQRHGFNTDRFAAFLDGFVQPRTAILRLGDPALAPLAFMLDHHIRVQPHAAIVAVYADPTPQTPWPALAAYLRSAMGSVPVMIAARPLLEDELGRVLRRELVVFLLLAFAGNLLLLVVLLRDVRTALAVLYPVALVVLALFAFMAAAGISIDPVNLIVPPLVVGIGVDNGVYLLAIARQCGSIDAAVRSLGRALTITSLTTIAGFGFLGLSAYPPLATLGRLMALGLVLSLIATFGLLPALAPRTARCLPGADPSAPEQL